MKLGIQEFIGTLYSENDSKNVFNIDIDSILFHNYADNQSQYFLVSR